MLDAVPAEIRHCPQWLVWKLVWNEKRGKYDKIPMSVNTQRECDINLPASWCGVDAALAIVRQYPHIGLGFALGYGSDVVGLDVDDVFAKDGTVQNALTYQIAGSFQTYTEYSPSGFGLHALGRGQLDKGRRLPGVEIYGSGRFFTITGRVYANAGMLRNCQPEIDSLVAQIDAQRTQSAPTTLNWSDSGTYTDKEVYDIALAASNGERFFLLWQGRFLEAGFPSQSEADFALINILGFYTSSPYQIQRLFRMSGLGQREKAGRDDYLNGMIARSQDNKPPLVQLGITPPLQTAPVAATPVVEPTSSYEAADEIFAIPGGFARELYDWLWQQSLWPMSELCMVTALGLMAGVCGRQYQLNGSGLNLYMMLLADTGMGKDAMSQGVSRLFDAVCNPLQSLEPDPHNLNVGFPAARGFQGPGTLTGKGLINSFKDSTTLSILTVWTEFSREMAKMASPNANDGTLGFQTALLDFYTKSGKGSVYSGSRNSDNKQTVEPISSPAFSIITEGTPAKFYSALNEAMITEGLLSRFIIIESRANPTYNKASRHYQSPPAHVKETFANYCKHVMQLKQNADMRIDVKLDDDAEELSEKLMFKYRNRGLQSGLHEVTKALWMRGHQNLTRIAALVAIGHSPFTPTVTCEMLLWADRIIDRQIGLIINKFKRGEVGEQDGKDAEQYEAVYQAAVKWLQTEPTEYKDDYLRNARQANVLPYRYVMQRVHGLAAFKGIRISLKQALQNALEQHEKTGTLQRVTFGDKGQGQFWKVCL